MVFQREDVVYRMSSSTSDALVSTFYSVLMMVVWVSMKMSRRSWMRMRMRKVMVRMVMLNFSQIVI